MVLNKIDIAEKFNLFEEHWTPKVLAEANEQLVKIAKGKGKLVWHNHAHEDELFIVFAGCLKLHLKPLPVPKDSQPKDSQQESSEEQIQTIELNPGEMFIVPKGMEHCPEADDETHFMMLEPKSTQHTGKHDTEQTVAFEDQQWI